MPRNNSEQRKDERRDDAKRREETYMMEGTPAQRAAQRGYRHKGVEPPKGSRHA